MENNLDVGGIVIDVSSGEIIAYTHEGINKLTEKEQYRLVILSLVERCRQA